jgi:hypothetical protein
METTMEMSSRWICPKDLEFVVVDWPMMVVTLEEYLPSRVGQVIEASLQ